MIRAIIIDDEKSSCDTLSLLLKNYCTEVELVGEAYSAEDGARLLESQRLSTYRMLKGKPPGVEELPPHPLTQRFRPLPSFAAHPALPAHTIYGIPH